MAIISWDIFCEALTHVVVGRESVLMAPVGGPDVVWYVFEECFLLLVYT